MALVTVPANPVSADDVVETPQDPQELWPTLDEQDLAVIEAAPPDSVVVGTATDDGEISLSPAQPSDSGPAPASPLDVVPFDQEQQAIVCVALVNNPVGLSNGSMFQITQATCNATVLSLIVTGCFIAFFDAADETCATTCGFFTSSRDITVDGPCDLGQAYFGRGSLRATFANVTDTDEGESTGSDVCG